MAWPGAAMNSIEGKDGWYSIDIAAEDLTGYNIIFNNGSGAQTGDLSIPTDDKVLFTVPSNSWDSATTGWSTKE